MLTPSSLQRSYTCRCCGRRGVRLLIRLEPQVVLGQFVEPVVAFCPRCDQGEPSSYQRPGPPPPATRES